jgi:serine protease Do
VDQEFAASLGIKEGAVVSKLDRGTPADRSGIQRLDVITAVDGAAIKSSEDLVAAIAGRRAGEKVIITVWRDGKHKDIQVTLGDRRNLEPGRADEEQDGPAAPGKGTGRYGQMDLEKTYGFTVEELNAANRHQYGISMDAKGVVVTHVSARSQAMDKGLREGHLISAVGTHDVQNLQQFRDEVDKVGGKKPLLLLLRVPGNRSQVTIAVPPR